MEATNVIKKPLITEKATFASALGRYTFQVDQRASKPQIKRAVEELYGVSVVSVATQVRKGQMRRNKFGNWRAKAMKQAVVKVAEGQQIELF